MASKTPDDHEAVDKTAKPAHSGGKLFFAVVALCLIAVGGVAATTLSDSLPNNTLSEADPSTTSSTAATQISTTSPAAAADTPTATEAVTTTTEAHVLYVLPLSNRVITSFSEQPIYSETMDDYRPHLGVDFGGNDGQDVRALADGVVTANDEDPIYGECITLDHGGGIVSIYRGVTSHIAIGTELSVGETIGTLSSVPCESALEPHLHLELYQDGAAIDPTTLLSGQLTIE